MATQLARVAIEAKHDEMLRALLEGADDGILVTDLAGIMLRVNHAFAGMLGYVPTELHGRNVTDITERESNPAVTEEALSLAGAEIARGRRYRGKSGALLWARERWALRRNAAGEPRYLLIRVRKMADAGQDPLEQLSPREREVLELVIAGRTSKEISARLGVAPASVDTYRSRIMQKLSIEDLPALVRFAIRHGITSV
jgi:PAS domain S-box-containing protein